jgi:DNA-binding response OmpR family regulator
MKILVAEDNADSRIYLERILKSGGYAVDSAENGRLALAKAQESPPDLIISDILMPELDGFALCRHWKADAMLCRIPFVFYTATYTDSRDEELALKLGADRFVIKPQPPEVLLPIIRDVLDGAGAARSEAEPDQYLEQHNKALFRKLEQKVQALEREIAHRQQMEAEFRRDAETARQMQTALLAPPPDNPCVEVAAVYQPVSPWAAISTSSTGDATASCCGAFCSRRWGRA